MNYINKIEEPRLYFQDEIPLYVIVCIQQVQVTTPTIEPNL